MLPGRMLNMLAPELAPIVHAIFTQSLDTGLGQSSSIPEQT